MKITEWIIQCNAWIFRTRPLPTEDIIWDVGYDGWRARFNPKFKDSGGASEGGGGSIPAKIVSKSGTCYIVDLYENDLVTASQTNQSVALLQLSYNDTLPAGTWVMVSESALGSTGGGNVN